MKFMHNICIYTYQICDEFHVHHSNVLRITHNPFSTTTHIYRLPRSRARTVQSHDGRDRQLAGMLPPLDWKARRPADGAGAAGARTRSVVQLVHVAPLGEIRLLGNGESRALE